MALRKGKIQEEDASQLKLGQEFDMAGCLSISEVKLLLETGEKRADTAVYKKTHEYVNQFARFNSTDSAQAARQILSKDTTLKQFELAQLASLCPEEAEEAKSLIPSIAGKDDDALQALLNEISGLKRYQG
ncbi:RNA polymerase B [Puccinia graminis f. sp. tritici]|uniref:DNA-directed RNA polymerase II subunit D n=2 Tax=Puccinia graminis f. sp. tritici TaxID=56615 RepID=E3JRU9_PUCGT|nr:DNA-directed RNA polymerase II subunit D [Puccinia graminis f. sp. tritici CRL 75-36-700-3]EFP74549.1 DNA-directed RNA polymerase II subunit D [Puccinia graminis f. sp. tritici CRL 75-36-700-3]KAA1063760.1 RNA polymerase B [Puccinia graminis f. sp. tritici]KAA1115032.1 RNA polymerase B [Puccinia graminis f. sp. tritici]KAA1127199.1 RNA polymerase B [Puccinia graminis f. sp. tritici]